MRFKNVYRIYRFNITVKIVPKFSSSVGKWPLTSGQSASQSVQVVALPSISSTGLGAKRKLIIQVVWDKIMNAFKNHHSVIQVESIVNRQPI